MLASRRTPGGCAASTGASAKTCGEPAEAVYDLRGVTVQLLEHASGNGEGYPEPAPAALYRLKKNFVHGQVALLRNAAQYGPVDEIVIVM